MRHSALLQRLEHEAARLSGTGGIRLVVSEDNETFYTVDQPHEEIAPETLKHWKQRGEHLIVIDFDDAQL